MMKPRAVMVSFMSLALSCLWAWPAAAADGKKLGEEGTPLQPNGKWHVHDGSRPQPVVVTPGKFPVGVDPGAPPSDATVLLGGGQDLTGWQHNDGKPATWKMNAGVLETGQGAIETKTKFRDFQLHVEWASPSVPKGDGQARGNSGVILLGRFEVQVLDSFQNPTYPDGQASALYGEFPPLVNASRKPGEWQSYDIAFQAPRFGADGKLTSGALITVMHNGVFVHHATTFYGPTSYRKIADYAPSTAEGPIRLQDHGNPVRYRNIWIRPIKAYE